MDWLAVMKERHSVRQYTDRKIPEEIRQKLSDEVATLNLESGLDMQIFFDEPECFSSAMAHYGKFAGVQNYLAIVGKKRRNLEERAGYYGEHFVLTARSLGLNSCWVGLTHGKSHAVIGNGEKQAVVICFGYGENQGQPHHGKPLSELCSVDGEMPDWFEKGMEGAMLSPTAVNQQKFRILYDGNRLRAETTGRGFFTKMDLGIVKCDFELASGKRFDQK